MALNFEQELTLTKLINVKLDICKRKQAPWANLDDSSVAFTDI